MSFTLDRSTNIGKVRTLIGDTDSANIFLDDEDIQTILDMEDNELKLTAASCLEIMATKMVAILKKVSLMDLSTDGTVVSAEFRKLAASLRKQYETDSSYGGFDISEQLENVFSLREKIAKDGVASS